MRPPYATTWWYTIWCTNHSNNLCGGASQEDIGKLKKQLNASIEDIEKLEKELSASKEGIGKLKKELSASIEDIEEELKNTAVVGKFKQNTKRKSLRKVLNYLSTGLTTFYLSVGALSLSSLLLICLLVWVGVAMVRRNRAWMLD